MSTVKNITAGIKSSPVALFYILEDARRNSDFKCAAEAQQQLERLGVVVKYKRAKQQKEYSNAG